MKKWFFLLSITLILTAFPPFSVLAKDSSHRIYEKYTEWNQLDLHYEPQMGNMVLVEKDIVIKHIELPEPLLKFDSLTALEAAITFIPATLPKNSDFVLKDCQLINQAMVNLRYENADTESDLTLRSQLNADSAITGYQNLSYQAATYKSRDYQFASYTEEGDTDYIAYFVKGDVSYAMIGEHMTQEVFESCLYKVMDGMR